MATNTFLKHALLASGVGLLLLVSCSKGMDDLALKLKNDKEFKSCDIKKIISTSPIGIMEYVFEYNDKGDPSRITPSYVSTGSPRHEFRYDKQGRLTDYIGPYNNGAFEFWHEYGYDHKNRIVQDTCHIFGLYGDEPSQGWDPSFRITTLEYDIQDRVIKSITVYPFAPMPIPPEVRTYTPSNTAGYENTVNVHRTSRVWMFIARDYNPRNLWPADAYNSYGLPTIFSSPQGAPILGLQNALRIEYTCKGDAEN